MPAFILSHMFALAYTPLVSDFPIQASGTGNLGAYINTVITFAIGLAGILAVIMIIIGGLQYVSTDAWSGKSDGKNKIMAALGGLVLALASYMILNTVNPTLTDLTFDIKTITGLSKSGAQISVDAPPPSPIGPGIDGVPLGSNATQPTSPTWYSNGSIAATQAIANIKRNDTLVATPTGFYIVPSKVAIDTDGAGEPPFYDPTRQTLTSYAPGGKSLNANTDFFVVAPVGDGRVKTGSKVLVTNHSNGKQIWAVLGDRGPGYGEMSLAAAKALGVWKDGMGDAADENQVISYEFYK
jgi:hypothetical protein